MDRDRVGSDTMNTACMWMVYSWKDGSYDVVARVDAAVEHVNRNPWLGSAWILLPFAVVGE